MLTLYTDEIPEVNMDCNIITHLLIIYSTFVRQRKGMEVQWNNTPVIYGLIRREVLYSIRIECGTLMKLIRLIEMCLNEILSKLRTGKQVSDAFPIQNRLKQRNDLSTLLLLYNTPLGRSNKFRKDWNCRYTPASAQSCSK
jgi:hypothetical protein